MATFPGLLRAYMVRGRWSNSKLAEVAGCDHTLVHRYLRDTRQPTRLKVEDIAAALDLTPAESDALFVAAGFSPADIPADLLVSAITKARRQLAEREAA